MPFCVKCKNHLENYDKFWRKCGSINPDFKRVKEGFQSEVVVSDDKTVGVGRVVYVSISTSNYFLHIKKIKHYEILC